MMAADVAMEVRCDDVLVLVAEVHHFLLDTCRFVIENDSDDAISSRSSSRLSSNSPIRFGCFSNDFPTQESFVVETPDDTFTVGGSKALQRPYIN